MPYRNSKLTLLLSDALGARGSSAKTLLLLSVSPAASSAPETLRTARFGERCAAVCLGSVRKQARKVDKTAERAERAEEQAKRVNERLETAQAETRRHAQRAAAAEAAAAEAEAAAAAAVARGAKAAMAADEREVMATRETAALRAQLEEVLLGVGVGQQLEEVPLGVGGRVSVRVAAGGGAVGGRGMGRAAAGGGATSTS